MARAGENTGVLGRIVAKKAGRGRVVGVTAYRGTKIEEKIKGVNRQWPLAGVAAYQE